MAAPSTLSRSKSKPQNVPYSNDAHQPLQSRYYPSNARNRFTTSDSDSEQDLQRDKNKVGFYY